METKMTVFHVFLLVLAIDGNTDTLHVKAPSNGLQEYDYLSVVFQWPRSFCNTGFNIYSKPIPDHFIVHGLWPQLHSGRRIGCSTAPKLNYAPESYNQLGPTVLQYMKVYWPNLKSRADNNSFWNHEYRKHGSCFHQFHSQQRLSYFRETVQRAEPFRRVLDMMFLSRGGILPNDNQGNYYLLGDIEDAIFNHFKSIPRLRCNYSNRRIIQLYEIEFCFDKNWTLRNCNNHFRDFTCCGNKLKVLFPRYS